jgi:hypothetical protein
MPVLSLSNAKLPKHLRSCVERLLRAGFGVGSVPYVISPSTMVTVDLTLEDFELLSETLAPSVPTPRTVVSKYSLNRQTDEIGFSLNFNLMP